MGRKKKPGKGLENKHDEPRRIRFELEADAEDLFLKHLDEFKPEKANTEEPTRQARKSGKPRQVGSGLEIDLHGLKLIEAQERVREVLDRLRETAGMHRVKIITGKGHHSRHGDSVLAKEIHSFVQVIYRPWIQDIEDSPDQVRLAGIPLRGHFHITLLGKAPRS